MTKIDVVLCPGLLNDIGLWQHQVDSLQDIATFQVADLSRHDRIGDMAQAILDRAPERFVLAGLSMGGYVSFEIMRRAPERVIRLALFDTSSTATNEESRAQRVEMIKLAQKGGLSRMFEQMLPNLLSPVNLDNSRIVGEVRNMAERAGAETFARQQTAIMNRLDSRPGLSAITCPALVVCGRQDALTPPGQMAGIATAIPEARFVVIEEAGHLTPLEQPQAVSALLRYWLVE